MSKFTIRIESTPVSRALLPWIALTRHGRQSVESQCFAIIGYAPEDLAGLAGPGLEHARDALTFGTRLMNAFEYIPADDPQTDAFFEKKILGFEERITSAYPDIPRLQAVIGVVQGTRVLFAASGDMFALQITPHSITNLAEVSHDGPLHFETFRSGNLNQQSLLLFIPKVLGTLLKSDELKNLHSAKSSERKLEYLEHLGEKRLTNASRFQAILLEARPKLVKNLETTAVSIAQLLATESKTEDLLSPPLLRPILERLKSAAQQTSVKLQALVSAFTLPDHTPRRPQKTSLPKSRPKNEFKSPIPEPLPANLPAEDPVRAPDRAIPRTLSSSLMHLSAWGKTTFASKTADIKTKIRLQPVSLLNNLRARVPRSLEDMIARFNILPQGSKLLFLLGILLIFVLAQGIFLTTRARAIRGTEATLKNELAAIQTLIDDARAALIYNDEEKTRAQIAEAQARLDAFPAFQSRAIADVSLARFRRETYIPKSALTELAAAMLPLQEQLRHAVSIETPATLDPAAKNIPSLKDEVPTSVVFRRRLYALEAPLNQIIKREPTKDGFDEGKPWITDGSDISKMATLTIDGSIYLTDSAGTVVELLKGRKTAFVLAPIDPPLTTIKKIWTDENSAYLYVLDSAQKRLLAFYKKDGLLKIQYTSPRFSDLKDFAIDETKRTAYLLDGSSTLSLPLSHLTSK